VANFLQNLATGVKTGTPTKEGAQLVNGALGALGGLGTALATPGSVAQKAATGINTGTNIAQAAGQAIQTAQNNPQAQTQAPDLNSMMTNIMGTITQMYQQAGNDAGTQAMISSWMGNMSAQISQLESQIMKQIQDKTGANDTALQAALGELRTQFDESRKSIIEDMAARGVAQSGIQLEMDARLQKGMLSESQKMIASRLDEMQNLMMSAMMQFANMRMQAQNQGLNLQVQSSMAAQQRTMQAAQTGIGAMLNYAGMLNSNQQAGLDRDLSKWLQQNSQQFQTGQQNNAFAHDEKMAGINFNNQQTLQTNNQEFQKGMQTAGFAQDEKMAGIAHQYNLDLNAVQNAQQQALQAAGFTHDEKMAGINYGNQLSLQNNAYGHQQELAAQGWSHDLQMAGINQANNMALQNDAQAHDVAMKQQAQGASDLTRLNQHVMEKYLPMISSGQLTPQAALSKLNDEMNAAAAAGFPWSDQHKAYATTLINSYAGFQGKGGAGTAGANAFPAGATLGSSFGTMAANAFKSQTVNNPFSGAYWLNTALDAANYIKNIPIGPKAPTQ
jgi:hypothetical protein